MTRPEPAPGYDPDQAAAALAMFAATLPHPARDGDCLTRAPAATGILRRHGVNAATITVTGWATINGRDTILFMHHATAVGDQVIDLAATQFDPTLPHLWTTSRDNYTTRLASVTGAPRVTCTNT